MMLPMELKNIRYQMIDRADSIANDIFSASGGILQPEVRIVDKGQQTLVEPGSLIIKVPVAGFLTHKLHDSALYNLQNAVHRAQQQIDWKAYHKYLNESNGEIPYTPIDKDRATGFTPRSEKELAQLYAAEAMTLVRIADKLDQCGMFKQADILTRIANENYYPSTYYDMLDSDNPTALQQEPENIKRVREPNRFIPEQPIEKEIPEAEPIETATEPKSAKEIAEIILLKIINDPELEDLATQYLQASKN